MAKRQENCVVSMKYKKKQGSVTKTGHRKLRDCIEMTILKFKTVSHRSVLSVTDLPCFCHFYYILKFTFFTK